MSGGLEMKHATAASLDRLEALLTAIRAQAVLMEKSRGVFYLRSPAMLHFHEDPAGQKSWQLIDAAGCRGLRIGAAQMSELHCNFLVNHGAATATEIEALGEEVRRRVREHSGVELEWEIKRVGLKPPALTS